MFFFSFLFTLTNIATNNDGVERQQQQIFVINEGKRQQKKEPKHKVNQIPTWHLERIN